MTAKALGRVGEADDMHLAVVGSGDVCAAHKAHHVVDEQDVKAAVPGVEKERTLTMTSTTRSVVWSRA